MKKINKICNNKTELLGDIVYMQKRLQDYVDILMNDVNNLVNEALENDASIKRIRDIKIELLKIGAGYHVVCKSKK